MSVFDPSIWDSKEVSTLLSAVQAAGTRAQAKVVLADLLTLKEINELANRITIAGMLAQKQTYQAIQDQTGASTATIAEISKKLKTGSGGFRLILRLMSEQQNLLY